MDLQFTSTQEMLRQTCREFLSNELPLASHRKLWEQQGSDRKLWKDMADVGWTGLFISEDSGGGGGNLLDVAVILEEMGRAAIITPFLTTAVLAAQLIQNSPPTNKHRNLLSGIISGEYIFALAMIEESGQYDSHTIHTIATKSKNEYVLTGTKLFVEYAESADYLLVVARTREWEEKSLGLNCIVVPGDNANIHCLPVQSLSGESMGEITLDAVHVPTEALLGKEGDGWPAIKKALDICTALVCVELAGIANKALEITLEYVNQRRQFNQPLGQFQAVQHHCANMAIQAEGARLAAYHVISKLALGLPSTRALSVAKAFCSQAAREVTLTAHQLHGGVGFIQDYPLHFYTRRAKALELQLGTPREHLQLLATEIGL